MASPPQKCHVLEAWRLGILLYSRNLFLANEDITGEVSAMAREVLSHAEAVPVASGWAYSMLWSLFQAGLVLTSQGDSSDREWLRNHILTMLRAVGCGGFHNALETLNMAWSRYDVGQSRAEVVTEIMSGPLIMA